MFDKRDLKLALYTSSIIIGAGLLTLPLAAAHLGYIPLVVVIILIGVYMTYVYRRIAASLYSYLRNTVELKLIRGGGLTPGTGTERSAPAPDDQIRIAAEVRERGSRLLAEHTRDAGLGKAGRFSIVLGMLLYVFFADIGYALIGSRCLIRIADFIEQHAPQTFMILLAIGIASIFVAWNLERILVQPFLLRGTVKKMLAMAGAWLIGINILEFAQRSGVGTGVMSIMALGLFGGAVLAGMYTQTPDTGSAHKGDLSDQHTVNVVVTLFELALLAITAVVTLTIAATHSTIVPAFQAFGATAFSLSSLGDWATLIGVVIFSFVGTGIFNLCTYPALFECAAGRTPRIKRVVVLGTLIPMIAYLVWSLTSATVLSPSMLQILDQNKEFTTLGIGQLFATFEPIGALLIVIFGYSMALLAVTSACNGFTESLADQLTVALEDARRARWVTHSRDNLRMRLLIVVAAVVTAFITDQVITINISSILSVAGNAGGGLLILILPYFLPPAGRRKTRWSSVMIGTTTAFVLTMLSLNAANIASVHDVPSGIVAMITVGIALCITAMAFWLIRSEPEAGGEPPLPPGNPPALLVEDRHSSLLKA